MTNAKVAIELYVDDKGTLRIKQFSSDAEQSFKKVEQAGTSAAGGIQGAWEQLKGAWVGIVAAIMAMREAWDMANLAAKAKQEEIAFANLAASYGTNSKVIIAALKEASGQTIDTMTLIRNAGTAMMMGIAPDKVTELMKIARATAKMTGQTTVKAFEDITLAVGRQSKMILDNLGIIVDVEKANETYAKSLGKIVSQLTDTEKKQAFMNATLTAGGELMDKMGNQTDTAADKLERWKARWTDATVVIGNGILTIAMGVEGLFTGIGVAINGSIGLVGKFESKLTGLMARIPLAGRLFKPIADGLEAVSENAEIAADIGLKHMKETWDTMLSLWKKGEPTANNVLKNLQGQKQATTDLAKEQEKLLALNKKDEANTAATAKEMYKELGQGAESYFSAEATELVKKAAKWKEAGAETLVVEEWLYDQLGQLSAQAWEKQETDAGLAMDNLQAQSRTLVDEMLATTQAGMEQLDQYGIKIDGLDGTAFTVYAALDGSGIESTIDRLIGRFQQLAAVASSAGSAGSSSVPYENTDSSKSAAQVASEQASYNSSTTININQKMSRSDVNSIISEQNRLEARS